MNPTNQPVSFYGDNSRGTDTALLAALATKDYYNPVDSVTAGGVNDLRGEVANNRWFVKDAEANIRAEIRHEGQEVLSATKDVGTLVKDAECRITQKLGDVECKIIKENSDQTLYLTNQLSVIREQGIRNEYETKLSREQVIKEINTAAQHNAERAQDKIDHGFEEINEKLAECCCDQELSSATQIGLLNIIANVLGVPAVKK